MKLVKKNVFVPLGTSTIEGFIPESLEFQTATCPINTYPLTKSFQRGWSTAGLAEESVLSPLVPFGSVHRARNVERTLEDVLAM